MESNAEPARQQQSRLRSSISLRESIALPRRTSADGLTSRSSGLQPSSNGPEGRNRKDGHDEEAERSRNKVRNNNLQRRSGTMDQERSRAKIIGKFERGEGSQRRRRTGNVLATGGAGEEGEGWKQTALIVRLATPGKLVGTKRRHKMMGTDETPTPRSLTAKIEKSMITPSSELTDKTALKSDQSGPVRKLDLAREIRWRDETCHFNMKDVVRSLRPASTLLKPIPATYSWFPGAIPVDAIFPPGIPMTLVEIMAFYPHHIRWEGVQFRLLQHHYQAEDIVTMQAYYRGLDRHPLRSSKVDNLLHEGASTGSLSHVDAKTIRSSIDDLHTHDLHPGVRVQTVRKDFTAPSLDDLLRGVSFLPTGHGARELTQCLAWHARNRDSFTPRLQLSVLHVLSLIRALRSPLASRGDQDIDKLALAQWRDKNTLIDRPVDEETRRPARNVPGRKLPPRTGPTLEVNDKKGEVKLHMDLAIRHVLTFPMLAILAMAKAGLRHGIGKAERRRRARMGKVKRQIVM